MSFNKKKSAAGVLGRLLFNGFAPFVWEQGQYIFIAPLDGERSKEKARQHAICCVAEERGDGVVLEIRAILFPQGWQVFEPGQTGWARRYVF